MKKIKRGDADWLPQSSLPDAFRISHIVLRHCASTRAAAMFVSHVSMCPHLTHSCDPIHISAALSLPPYQRTFCLPMFPLYITPNGSNEIMIFLPIQFKERNLISRHPCSLLSSFGPQHSLQEAFHFPLARSLQLLW